MKTVITHPGQSHRDEFMAICMLIAADKVAVIERRDPTQEDLDDPDVIVLDVGQSHDPEFNNFDHHQFERDHPPVCSITLLLWELGIDPKEARKIWGWLEFSERLDSKGPFATAAHYGMTPDALFATVSPIETTVLRWFESDGHMLARPTPDANGLCLDPLPLWELMHRIGSEKLNYLHEVQERIAFLKEEAKVVEVEGLRVLDATCVCRKKNPVLGLEIYAEELGDIVATVTQDDRGDGLCLFRRNDDPHIDFSQIEESEGVLFAHKSGFVAKLHDGVDWSPMVQASMVTVGT